MKKLFLGTIALITILGFTINNGLANTYNFSDTWVDWPGYTSTTHQYIDEIGTPKIDSMDVLVVNGFLMSVNINLKTGSLQNYDSLFINTSYDGNNWPDWDYFIRDGYSTTKLGVVEDNSHQSSTDGQEAPDGFYSVKNPTGYSYTTTIDDSTIREKNPNGIIWGDLALMDTQVYDVTWGWMTSDPKSPYYDYSKISYTFGPKGLALNGGFFIAYSPWCANDVIGGGAPVPEPATMLLFGTGLIGLAGFARRRNKK